MLPGGRGFFTMEEKEKERQRKAEIAARRAAEEEERKKNRGKKKADKPYYDHVVQVGESMHSIAQKYGIQIKSLYKMNKKHKDYIPEEGDVLKLR